MQDSALIKMSRRQLLFFRQVVPSACVGKLLGPNGEQIKALSARTGCSVVVEAKPPNAAFVPFRIVNYMAPTLDGLLQAVYVSAGWGGMGGWGGGGGGSRQEGQLCVHVCGCVPTAVHGLQVIRCGIGAAN
jgi:hypothetical protein